MTKVEAFERFHREILPLLPPDDKPARDQAWNDWTDGLQKNGEITARQYSTWTHPYNER